jgi:hypothetical protein
MAKGSSFEREIAHDLSVWWSQGKRDDIFYRSNASGARFTQRKKTGKTTENQAGDITFTDSEGELLIQNFNFELKTGYGTKTKTGITKWDALDFIDSQQKEPVLKKMWLQCYRDASETGRKPVLIFRRNNRKPCIVFLVEYFQHLVQWFNLPDCSIVQIDGIIMTSLEDFFIWIPDIRPALITKKRLLKRMNS